MADQKQPATGISESEAAYAFPQNESAEVSSQASKPTVRYLRETSKDVGLEYPMEVGGKEYRVIRVINLPIGAFRKYLEGGGDSQTFRLPMFVDETGAPIPQEALDALMFVDAEAVRGAAEDFLSKRSLDEAKSEPVPVTGDEPQQ